MSFILDALKKSETDRARQSGPALYEVKVPPPRTGLPLWALVVVALLAVNLGIGLWMLLRHPAHTSADTAATPAAAGAAGQSAAPAPAVAATVPAAAQAPVTVPTQTVSAQVPAGTAPAAAAPAAPESNNPEDYEPAGPAPPSATGPASHVQRGTAEGVPLYQEVATAQGATLPQLRLDLHAYAADPSQRFVMINMRKLKEGDTLPEGVHVDSITPDGAVLSYNGSRFLLTRD
jgi:general secretion pathway protein B